MRSTKPMSVGRLSILLAAALFAIFAIAGTATASAACSQPFNCFAGDDGDQASGPNGLTDWQDVASSVTSITDPVKGVDTKFSGGSKETNPGGWDFILGNNTPKDDLLEGWSLFDGRFLDVAFSRFKQQGDTFLAFELNQLPAAGTTTAGIPKPQRSTGDILFTYDISTTNALSFGMCTWQGDANSGNWLKLDGTPVGGSVKECSTLNKQTTPAAEGNVNWTNPINPNYLPDFAPIGAGQFGEAAVDLGALGGKFLTNPCGPNGWLWMHSRASRSVTSQPKDLIGGAPITSPTCGLTIDKKVSLSGDPGTYVDSDANNPLATKVGDTLHYAITVTNTGTAPLTVNVTDDKCDAGTLTGPGGATGTNDPLAGGASITYTCTHVVTANDPQVLVNTACTTGTATLGTASTTLGVDPTICDSVASKTFPPEQLATVSGVKFQDTNGNGVQDAGEGPLGGFTFYVDYNGNGTFDSGEPSATSSNVDGSWTIIDVVPGTYAVREVGKAGYTCTAPGSGAACMYSETLAGGQTASGLIFGNQPNPNPPGSPQTPAGQVVAGTRVTAGSARLLGPTGCVARAFYARVRGVSVAKVVFTLDGKRVSTLTRKNLHGTYAIRINPSHLRVGVHRLVVKVTFKRGSGTKAKTLRLAFQRCTRALRAPRFTG